MENIHIVTGASRGIGREVTKTLANNGKKVLVLARSTAKLKELELEYPQHVKAYPVDVLDKKAVSAFFEFIENHSYNVATLINNAGLLVKGAFLDLKDEDWMKMFNIHVMAPVRLTRGLVAHFSKGAHIVNISSMAGFQGSIKFPGLSAYSTAKGALATATEAIAAELSSRHIHCNALCIGAVQTEMLEEAFPGFEAPVTADQMGSYIADFALNGRELFNGQVLPVNVLDPQ